MQDAELVFSRLKEKYPKVQVLKRPGNRPFAGISTHDPAVVFAARAMRRFASETEAALMFGIAGAAALIVTSITRYSARPA